MSYHDDTERALDGIESALQDARDALSCLPDTPDDLEADLGNAVDELRAVWEGLSGIGTTDLEDVESECAQYASTLEDIITTLNDHWGRL
jgi:hypothetical protein